MVVKLRSSSMCDFHCPFCDAELGWDENLYAFTFEKVECSECKEQFLLKKEIKTTYEIKFIKEK